MTLIVAPTVNYRSFGGCHAVTTMSLLQHRSEEMTKRTNISRLKYSTIVLVAVAALMGSAHIAKAKGDHHQGNNSQGNGARPHFVISGQPANVKRVLRTNKKKEMAEKKKKACGNIIVPTAECGVNPKNPVGSTRPALPPSQADGNKANPKGPSPAYTTVTLSNSVTTSAIFSGKGLTVTSTSPGTITVSNGTNTVTMPGGSMNLSGAASVQAGAGVQAAGNATRGYRREPDCWRWRRWCDRWCRLGRGCYRTSYPGSQGDGRQGH
ncbi:MAG: hypothetical protein WBL43_05055 [Pseudolabrys sp.]